MAFAVDDNSTLTFTGNLDVSTKKATGGVSAMKKFQSLDRQAMTSSNTSLGTLHQNAVTSLCLHTGTKAGATKFSTTGIDGLIAIWDFKVCQILESTIWNCDCLVLLKAFSILFVFTVNFFNGKWKIELFCKKEKETIGDLHNWDIKLVINILIERHISIYERTWCFCFNGWELKFESDESFTPPFI